MYVYLHQGDESVEDWVRQWHQLIVPEPQRPVGGKEDIVRLTLFVITVPSCVSQCVCTRVSVSVWLPQETTTSIQHTHHTGHRWVKYKECAFKVADIHFIYKVLVPHNAFVKHANDMYIYFHTNIKHTHQCDPQTWCTNKSNADILKHTPQVFCINVIHVKESTPMYVYLRQGVQSGEDWDRQWGYLVVVKTKDPVGRRERKQSGLHSFTIPASCVYDVNEVLVPHNAFGIHAKQYVYIFPH